MSIVEKLAANQVFAGLSPSALAPVPGAGEVIQAKAGDRLIEEGQTNNHLFLVLDGAVEVRLLENPGRFSGVRLGIRDGGTCIGEYAFIDNKPASATVIAIEPSELFKISYKDLQTLLATDDTLGRTFYQNLLVHLVDRLRATNAELDLFRPI